MERFHFLWKFEDGTHIPETEECFEWRLVAQDGMQMPETEVLLVEFLFFIFFVFLWDFSFLLRTEYRCLKRKSVSGEVSLPVRFR